MRKIIILMLLFVLGNVAVITAQYKYKLEYKINHSVQFGSSNVQIKIGGQTIYSSFTIGNPDIQTVDRVLEYASPITSVSQTYNFQSSDENSCPSANGTDFFIFDRCSSVYFLVGGCANFNVQYFRLTELSSPLNVPDNNQITECDSFNIGVQECYIRTNNYALEYRINGVHQGDFKSYSIGSNTFSISDLPGVTAAGNSSFDIRARYGSDPNTTNMDYYSDWVPLNVIACSPEYQSNSTTDATCNEATNGSVTLTFDKNVDEPNGYTMRYFVYESTVDLNNIDELDPPSTVNERILTELVPINDGSGSYSGEFPIGLGSGTYKVLYQEGLYENGTFTPKSGEVVPDLIVIDEPTPVIINTAATNFFTDTNCGNPAIFLLNNTASGGNNIDAGGTYSYEYSMDNGANYDSVSPTNILEIEPTTSNQAIRIRSVYSVNGVSCYGAFYPYTISAEINPVVIINPTVGNSSTDTSTDGSIRIEFSGGTPSYTYSLSKWNTTTAVYDSQIGTPNEVVIPGGFAVSYTGLASGTYKITITDANGCPKESSDLVVEKDDIPILGTPQITQITCAGSLGSITVPISGFDTSYRYQWTVNGTPSTIQTASDTNLVLDNITVAGTYVLRVASGRISDTDFSIVANVRIANITMDNAATVVINSATPAATNCNNSTDGSISLGLSGGSSYEYTLELLPADSDWFSLNGNTITGLVAGIYRVKVRNQNLCESNSITNILVDEPDTISVTDTSTNATSVGGNQGTITLGITGGTPNTLAPDYDVTWTLDGATFNPSPSTANLTNLFAGVYQATVTDANGCSPSIAILPITITEPTLLNITGNTPTPVSCFNGNDGAILIQVTGGIGNLTYTWTNLDDVNWSTAQTNALSGLSEGRYQLTLSDQGSPTINYPAISITQPTAIVVNPISNEASCSSNDGGITVNVTGGTPPYQYQIDDGFGFQAINTFSNLAARTYVVTVRDDLGCEYNTNVIVAQSGAPVLDQAATVVNNASSNTSSDGSIVLQFETKPTPANYTYAWSNGNNTKDLLNIASGTYQVTVTAPGNCTVVEQFTVGIAEAFSVASIISSPSCFNASNGFLTATVDATGSVIHNWRNAIDDSLIASETTNLRTVIETGLQAGTYYLEIVDATDVTKTARSIDVEITSNLEVNADVAVTRTCFGESSGSIIFSSPEGSLTNSYLFSIDGGNTFVTTMSFNNLAAGTYQLVIRATDNTNCDKEVPNVLIQTSPILLYDMANTVVTRASGPGANDGEITASVSGGTSPYQYSINGVDFQTSPIFTGLGAGTYNIVATDDTGCSETSEDIVVTEVGPLQITNINPVAATCKNEANGSIATTVTGEGNITYEWTLADGSAVPVSNGTDGEDITGILAGSYILTVTDDNSTVTSAVINVGEPTTALTIDTINSTNTTCNGIADGTIQITASGGTMPYQYSINGVDFEPLSTFANLSNGQYTVTVQDANGCSTTEPTPTLITEPVALSFIINEQRALTAANASDGAITITPSGGSGDYTYSWTGPNYTSDQEDIFGLEGGDYFLTLTDANNTNCSVSFPDAITITEPGVLLVTNTQTILLECNGDNFAEIEANVQGGVPPFIYEWFQVVNGNNILLTEDTNIIASLSAGEYFVRASDASGIVANATPVVVNEPQPLRITLDDSTNVLCYGEATAAISISVTGGTLPYQYIWSNGDTVEDINGLVAGNYTIEIIDGNNCVVEETITITSSFSAIQITDASVTNTSGYQVSDGSISLDITGGLAPYTYFWTRDSDNTNAGDQATIANLSADSYSVIITDANGCSITETYEVTQPDIVEDTISAPSCAGDANGSISVLINQGNGNFTYAWSTGATTNSINNLAAGTYSVTIDGFGNGLLTRTYVLEDPLPLVVNLGEDRVLCLDQELVLDATVEDITATYSWTSDNGFTSNAASITPSITGNYIVTVQTLSGCMAQGSAFIDITTDEIDAEFAMSSQVFVGETTVAVDISYPLPTGIEWIIPLGGKIITQDTDAVEFSFAEAGEYEITMITTRGSCIAQKTKKVIVLENDGTVPIDDSKDGTKTIEDFIIYPNPTTGAFTVDANLTERGNISIKVFSFANNQLVASEKERGNTSYSVPFNISGMPPGVYAVLLETPFGSYLQKIIIK